MLNDVIKWLIVLHVVICILYFVFFFRKNALFKCFFPFVIFFPHVWTILFLLGKTIIYEITRKTDYDKDELILPEFDGNSLVELDKEKETNIVPVEEALLLNGYDVKRRMVIEIAKRDPAGYLDKLKMALLSDDTETAHYAASSISHLKRSNDKRLRHAKEHYEHINTVSQYRENYINSLDMVIKSKLSVEAIITGYKDDVIDVLKEHIEFGEDISVDSYNMLINYLIEQMRLDEASEWTGKFETLYPDYEQPKVLELKINYLRNDRKSFNKTIDRINDSGFAISQETVDMIEFWKEH